MNPTQKGAVAIGLTAVVSLAAGSAAGYFYARTKLEKLYDERASFEIEAAKQFYKTLHKRDEFETAESAAQALIPIEVGPIADALAVYQGNIKEKTDISETDATKLVVPVERNVFDEESPSDEDLVTDEEWNAEIGKRTDQRPYILSQEEFLEAETDYIQTNLTYYAEDEVLADERDQHVEDVDKVVGLSNLMRFGFRSGDPNVVYVRNDRLQLDFEICRSTGSYRVQVLGFDPEKGKRSRRGEDG